MSVQGILVVDLLGAAFILWIINLLRVKRLRAGYAILWLSASLAVIVLVSVPPLLRLVTRAVGALFPASALSLIAFAFIFVVLILFSVRLSALTDRQARLAQSLALFELERAERKADPASSTDSAGFEQRAAGHGGEDDAAASVDL